MNPFDATKSHAGLDFFQSLLKGSGMPSGFASWMAPTLDADELERKIVDLRVVLQWLEANARLTQATIQALEVQRMTLSTLKSMNVDLGDLATHMGDAMRAGAQAMGAAAAAGVPRSEQARGEAAAEPAEPAAGQDGQAEHTGDAANAKQGQPASGMPGLIDPMQWWGSITEQFGKVAADALRETAWPMAASSPSAAAGAAAGGAATAGAAKPRRPAAGAAAAKGGKPAKATRGSASSGGAAGSRPAARKRSSAPR